MKVLTIALVLAAVVFVECGHTFMGTNVLRPLVYRKQLKYAPFVLTNRVEFLNYTLPAYYGRSIQGILAFDLTFSAASANITAGGIGYNFLTLCMKSERGKKMKYNVYIYV